MLRNFSAATETLDADRPLTVLTCSLLHGLCSNDRSHALSSILLSAQRESSATGSLLHDTGLSWMAVELAMRGYLRTNVVDGHRDFGRFGREYGRDVGCVVVSAAREFEAGSRC